MEQPPLVSIGGSCDHLAWRIGGGHDHPPWYRGWLHHPQSFCCGSRPPFRTFFFFFFFSFLFFLFFELKKKILLLEFIYLFIIIIIILKLWYLRKFKRNMIQFQLKNLVIPMLSPNKRIGMNRNGYSIPTSYS